MSCSTRNCDERWANLGREERKSKSKASALQSCRRREKNVKKFGVSAICGERKQMP